MEMESAKEKVLMALALASIGMDIVTQLLWHTLRSVVMARVAMLRLVSDIRFSRSTLHEVTASGWIMEIWE